MLRFFRKRQRSGSTWFFIIVLILGGIGVAAIAASQGEPTVLSAQSREPITREISNSWVEMSLEERIALADVIVRGEILNPLPSQWNTPDGQLPPGTDLPNISPDAVIFTDTPVKVNEYLKGSDGGEELLVRTLGGTFGQDTMTAAGPDLRPGQQVILFLSREGYEPWSVGPEHYWSIQGPLGVFEIVGQDVLTVPTREHPDRMPLADLLSRIGDGVRSVR